MENLPTTFTFKDNEIRTIIAEDKGVWWVAKDVCNVLGYTNHRDVVKRLCRKNGVWNPYPLMTSGGKQYLLCIDEGNLYRLIIKSTKPESEPFESWVCDEVLPTIRKTGGYAIPGLSDKGFDPAASPVHTEFEGMDAIFNFAAQELFITALRSNSKEKQRAARRKIVQTLGKQEHWYRPVWAEPASEAVVAELLASRPLWKKIKRYTEIGLTRRETSLLCRRDKATVRRHVRRMEACGVIAPPPDLPRLQTMAKHLIQEV